jgi:hypothetical protein
VRGGIVAQREARAVCESCPVATECLVFALTTAEKHGTWGGASERQRRVYRRPANLALILDQVDPDLLAAVTALTPPPGWAPGTTPPLDLPVPTSRRRSAEQRAAYNLTRPSRAKPPPEPVTTRQVMARLGVSKSAVSQLGRRGAIAFVGVRPSPRGPATRLYDRDSVEAYLARSRRPRPVRQPRRPGTTNPTNRTGTTAPSVRYGAVRSGMSANGKPHGTISAATATAKGELRFVLIITGKGRVIRG